MNNIAEILNLQESRTECCDSHGEFISRNLFREVWSRCPQCVAEQKALELIKADEQAAFARQQTWQRKLGEAAIPERFRTRTLKNFITETHEQRSALAFAESYAEDFERDVLKTGRSAIFCGHPGTGKTHLAVGIGLHVLRLNRIVLFTTVQRAVRRVKNSWRKDSTETESDVIGLLVQPDLLIVDEIGVQFGTAFEQNLLFDILNERYENRRPTLLLTNLTTQEVKVFLGERIYDRLRDDGGVCVPFDWGSYRGGGKEGNEEVIPA